MSLGSIEIGDWHVEPDLLRVERGDEARKLEPMAMRLLLFLATRPNEVISRAEILDDVWEGRAVVDETLSRAVSLVRTALGDDALDPTYIETLPRRGYRLIAPVKRRAAESTPTEGIARRPRRWWIPLAVAIVFGLLALWLLTRDTRERTRAAAQIQTLPDATQAASRPGIAVLPFKNLSSDPENDYLADGMTEELIHQLAGVAGLRVVSRTSSMRYRHSESLAPEIAKALGVDYLLEGTVLTVGQRLRITAQLIRPDRDEHLLSRSYDRDFSEVLDLQRQVARDVVEQTRITLSPTEATRLTLDRPVNQEAYRAYLKGYQLIQQRSDLVQGLNLLERSVELDPSFAPAWTTLADAYLLSNSYFGLPEAAAYAGAEPAIAKALELDPDFGPAHTSLGLLQLQRDRDWSGSEESYRRAIELEPSGVTSRQWYSELLSLSGRHDEALQQISLAIELDPLSPLVHAAAGQRLNAAGRYSESLSRFDDAEALGADFKWLFRERAWALEHSGRHQESLELLVGLAKTRSNVDDRQRADLDRAVEAKGLIGYYEWEIQNHFATITRRPGFPTWLAAAYSGAGQTEEALEWLAKATEEQNLWLLHTLKSPAFDAIRDDPRFVQLHRDLLRPRALTPTTSTDSPVTGD